MARTKTTYANKKTRKPAAKPPPKPPAAKPSPKPPKPPKRPANLAPSPSRPGKSAKFKCTEDDAYLTKLCILGGPTNKPKESTVMLAALGMGPALRLYDNVDYALPVEPETIKLMNHTMQENGWKLPVYNITQGGKQGEYPKRTKTAFTAFLTRQRKTKKLNTVYVSMEEANVSWDRIQNVLSSCLSFFLFVWILNPKVTKKQAYNLAIALLKSHIKNKKDRRKFFGRYIKQKRVKLAQALLDCLMDHLKEMK